MSFKCGIPSLVGISYSANQALAKAAEEGEHPESSIRRWGNARERQLTSVYHTCFKALQQTFAVSAGRNNERRVVVFLDDLDRCLPEKALQVLESMKLFFDLDGLIFVAGSDRAVVEWCIDLNYKARDDGTDARGTQSQIRGSVEKITPELR